MLFQFCKSIVFFLIFLVLIVFIFLLVFYISQFYSVSPLIANQNDAVILQDKRSSISDIIKRENLGQEVITHLYHLRDADDMRKIIAIIMGYIDVIDKYYWDYDVGDFVFHIGKQRIYYAGGRILNAANVQAKNLYHKTIYKYPLEIIQDVYEHIPRANKDIHILTRSTDLQNALTNNQAVSGFKIIRFLGQRITVHSLIIDTLTSLEKRLNELALLDRQVKLFLNEVYQVSSYSKRKVNKSENISMHSFGLAIDFLHKNYDKKAVYWQWSTIVYPDSWDKMPFNNLWLIPNSIISLFEEYGFVWGGKWANYDTIHFEYRPEIIEYAKLNTILDKDKK